MDVTGTDVDAGDNDYTIQYASASLERGFSIITGTLTNMTVTVLASNKDGVSADVTSDYFGVASLASNTAYIADIPSPVKKLFVRATRTNATNAVNLTVFVPKR